MNIKLIKQLMEADLFAGPSPEELEKRKAEKAAAHDAEFKRLAAMPVSTALLDALSDKIYAFYDDSVTNPSETHLFREISRWLWQAKGIPPEQAKRITTLWLNGADDTILQRVVENAVISESDLFSAPTKEEIARRKKAFEDSLHRMPLKELIPILADRAMTYYSNCGISPDLDDLNDYVAEQLSHYKDLSEDEAMRTLRAFHDNDWDEIDDQ